MPTVLDAVADDALDSDGGSEASRVLAPNAKDNTLDSGFYVPASLGDFVWLDDNQNGQQDPGEPGVRGVVIELRDWTGVVGSTTTDADGWHGFTNLRPGTYTIRAVEPADKVFTVATSGADATDSNVDRISGMSGPFGLTSGNDDRSVDIGVVPVGAVAGVVFVDTNKNGVQDPGESAIANVVVRLLIADGQVVGERATSPDGSYSFSKVPVGRYTLQQVQPERYASTTLDSVIIQVLASHTTTSLFGEAPSRFPATGASILTGLELAALLLGTGSVLVLANRRRRSLT